MQRAKKRRSPTSWTNLQCTFAQLATECKWEECATPRTNCVERELLQGVLAKKNMLSVPTENQCKVAAARAGRTLIIPVLSSSKSVRKAITLISSCFNWSRSSTNENIFNLSLCALCFWSLTFYLVRRRMKRRREEKRPLLLSKKTNLRYEHRESVQNFPERNRFHVIFEMFADI